MGRTLGHGSRWVCALVGLVTAAGCGGSVSFPEASGGSAAGSGGGAGSCGAGRSSSVPEVEITSPTSGAFVDGFLHLAARLDGEERYLVIAIQDGAGYVVATPDALLGPANLAPAGGGSHARIRISDGATWLDVIDTSAPANPVLQKSVPVDGSVPPAWQGTFTTVGDRLLTCLALEPETDAVLVAVPLTGEAPPEKLADGGNEPCTGWFGEEATGTALGSTWLSWKDGGYLAIFDASSKPVAQLADYNYSPDGIHAYGSVVSAATDGRRIVFDIGNDSRFFLYAMESGDATITHTWFGLDGPKKLLGVVEASAYVATASGVHVFDVSTIPETVPVDDWPTPLLDDHADIALGEGLATLVAADSQRLLLTDATGRAYLVPVHPSGPVAPMKFYRGPPPASGKACD